MIRTILVILSVLILGCSSERTPLVPPPFPLGPVESEAASEGVDTKPKENLVYDLKMAPNLTGEEAKWAEFNLPGLPENPGSLTIRFEFNSKDHSVLKLVESDVSSECLGSRSELQLSLYAGEEVVHSEVRTFGEYELKPNRSYSLIASYKEFSCREFNLKLMTWLGSPDEDALLAIGCGFRSLQLPDAEVVFFKQRTDRVYLDGTVWIDHKSRNPVFCGKPGPISSTSTQRMWTDSEVIVTGSVESFGRRRLAGYDLLVNLGRRGFGQVACFDEVGLTDYAILNDCKAYIEDYKRFESK